MERLEQLRRHTAPHHEKAEHEPLFQDLASGRVSIDLYAGYLARLEPVYAALEKQLAGQSNNLALKPLNIPAAFRAKAIASDLEVLAKIGGRDAEEAIREARAGLSAYAARIDALGETCPELLAAHCYVRYMGDMSGGQMIKAVLAEKLPAEALRFYSFEGGAGPLRRDYLERIQRSLQAQPDADAFYAEAGISFELTINLARETTRQFA